MFSIKKLVAALLASSFLTACTQNPGLKSTAVFYAAQPPVQLLSQYQRVIVEADNLRPDELLRLRENKAEVFAYLSIGEVSPTRHWHHRINQQWILGRNEAWGSDVLDLSNTGWQTFVLEELVTPLVGQGYDGLFLDTLDSFHLYANSEHERQLQANSLATLLQSIRKRHPKLKLIANRGFEVMPEIAHSLEAVLAESLFTHWDNAKQQYRFAKAQDTEWLLQKLQGIQKEYELEIIVIDYLPEGEREQARKLAKRIESLGFVPWISTPALNTLGIGLLEL